jgi:phosphoadenosine phosphosulfate reductase
MNIEEFIHLSETLDAKELIKKSFEVFKPNIIASTSFGATSGVIIDLIYKLKLPIKIVYVNTGFFFNETIDYIETLKKFYQDINFIEIGAKEDKETFLKKYGDDISKKNPDFCCRERKIIPFYDYIKNNSIKAWISGIRKDQTDFRKKLNKVEVLESGLIKIYPILNWTSKDVYNYLKDNNIPFHPLYEKGYTSIGCEPCTELPDLYDERSGRWKGLCKKECGLHLEIK